MRKSANLSRLQVTGEQGGSPSGSHGPTVEDARQFSRRQEQYIEKSMDDVWAPSQPTDARGRKSSASQFPMRLVPHDKDDTIFDIKAKYTDVAKLGTKTFTDRDAEYLLRKQEAQNLAGYKQFASTGVFDRQNIAELQLLNKIHPDFLEEQEAMVDARKEQLIQLAIMRARGFPETKEEMELAFAIASGNYQPPRGPLYNPNAWEDVTPQQSAKDAIQRGMFNPARLFLKPTAITVSDPIASAASQSWTARIAGSAEVKDANGTITQAAVPPRPGKRKPLGEGASNTILGQLFA